MQKIIRYINELGQHCILKIHANGTYEKIVEVEKTDAERILDYKAIHRAKQLELLWSEISAKTVGYSKGRIAYLKS